MSALYLCSVYSVCNGTKVKIIQKVWAARKDQKSPKPSQIILISFEIAISKSEFSYLCTLYMCTSIGYKAVMPFKNGPTNGVLPFKHDIFIGYPSFKVYRQLRAQAAIIVCVIQTRVVETNQ